MVFFDYPDAPHQRRHGPMGYTDYTSYKQWLRDEFTFRCAYCLVRERWERAGQGVFSVDHVVPQKIAPERVCDYDNLVYACTQCNSCRGARRLPLDPCSYALAAHVRVNTDGTVVGLTGAGRAFIAAMQLDHPILTEWRQLIIETLDYLPDASEGSMIEVHDWLRFPTDLPNLSLCRPPKGNSRRGGLTNTYFKQRAQGRLPTTY